MIFEKYYTNSCNRCGNQWISMYEHPKSCANRKCRSPYYNKARQRSNSKAKYLAM